MEVFAEPALLFFESKENIKLYDFEKVFFEKISFPNLQKKVKNTFPNTMAIDPS